MVELFAAPEVGLVDINAQGRALGINSNRKERKQVAVVSQEATVIHDQVPNAAFRWIDDDAIEATDLSVVMGSHLDAIKAREGPFDVSGVQVAQPRRS